MGESFIQKPKASLEIISQISELTAVEWSTHVNYQNFKKAPTGANGRHMTRERVDSLSLRDLGQPKSFPELNEKRTKPMSESSIDGLLLEKI